MVKRWSRLHRWSSLVCTLFLLILCLTGLPLIFSTEIDHAFDPAHYDAPRSGATAPSLDRLIAVGRAHYPGQAIISLFVEDDGSAITMRMAPSLKAVHADPSLEHLLIFDAHSGRLLREGARAELSARSPTALLLALHRSLLAGVAGELFLGVMGSLFVVAIVSGVALYGPFARKLAFGALRTQRKARVYWMDQHNLLGIVTLAWALVVGLTGVMNTLAVPLFGIWQQSEVAASLNAYAGQTVLRQDDLVSAQNAVDTAMKALPDRSMLSIGFPDNRDGSPWHYIVWLKGKTPLTADLMTPILIDARTGKLTAVVRMPWYLRALELSRPLHFGDYGGLPLKVLWALLDVVTIVVLGSGLYLWIARPRRERAAARGEGLHGASPAMEPAE